MDADRALPDASTRSATYRLLGRLALAEIDPSLAQSLDQLSELDQALAASGGVGALQRLRAEYTRTFLMNVHPYESVYLDESAMLNTPRTSLVLEHYRQHEFDPVSAAAVGAPDHLGLELEFMAHLAEREATARRDGNMPLGEVLRDEQIHFCEAHLLKWGPIFGRLLSETAESPFYQTLGEVLETFLLSDYQALMSNSLARRRR
jgi:TorA maturation chaperone TorD